MKNNNIKNIQVYLQFPWKQSDSSYYKYLSRFPPKNVNYSTSIKQDQIGIKKENPFSKQLNLKKILKKILKILKIPNLVYSKTDAQVIHCAHCLSLNKKPWVVDLEHYNALSAGYGEVTESWLGKKIIKSRLRSKYCKAILAWSEYSKDSIMKSLEDDEINKKITVVYPALSAGTEHPHKSINLLFVGRDFDYKGGRIALDVIDRLTRENSNIRGIFISETPEEFYKKYKKNGSIKFYNLMPQEKLFGEIYPKTDILIYPSRKDTFGLSIIEAMSFGAIPMLLNDNKFTDVFRELIIGKNKEDLGLLFKNADEFTSGIVDRITQLSKDNVDLKRMKSNCLKEIEKGKFSLIERDDKLREIYYKYAQEQ